MQLTIFSIPKSFKGTYDIIQKNAIKSWLRLKSKYEIILLGDDEGIKEVSNELGILHLGGVQRNEFGTPLLSSAFDLVKKKAKYDRLLYVNADIIFLSDLLTTAESINFPAFLVTGRRWDLNVTESIQFETENWENELRKRIKTESKLHTFSGIDYFIFPKSLNIPMPPFAVGRAGWDNWFIWWARSNKIPVIDATESITAVHQNHDYLHSKFGEKERIGGPEINNNFRLAGGFSQMLSLLDSDWTLRKNDLRRPFLLRRIISILSLFYPWRTIISFKRKLQNARYEFSNKKR